VNVIIPLYLPGRPSITGVRHCGCKLWATPDSVNENNGACFATYPPERVSFVNSDRDSSGPRLVDDRAISLAKNWTSDHFAARELDRAPKMVAAWKGDTLKQQLF